MLQNHCVEAPYLRVSGGSDAVKKREEKKEVVLAALRVGRESNPACLFDIRERGLVHDDAVLNSALLLNR